MGYRIKILLAIATLALLSVGCNKAEEASKDAPAAPVASGTTPEGGQEVAKPDAAQETTMQKGGAGSAEEQVGSKSGG